MNKLNIFCVTNIAYDYLNNLNLKLAGVGKKKFPNNYIVCNKGNNIQKKREIIQNLPFIIGFGKIK